MLEARSMYRAGNLILAKDKVIGVKNNMLQRLIFLFLGRMADVFSTLAHTTKGSIASILFKNLSKMCIHYSTSHAIKMLEKMEDSKKKQYLILEYQEILERNARS
jgi:hypothetical protein